MVPQYDIFKKTDNSAVWVEAVEDVVAAKKHLISLSTTSPGEYNFGIRHGKNSSIPWTNALRVMGENN